MSRWNQSVIPIPSALKIVGIIGGTWAILVVLTATLAYLPRHPPSLDSAGAVTNWRINLERFRGYCPNMSSLKPQVLGELPVAIKASEKNR